MGHKTRASPAPPLARRSFLTGALSLAAAAPIVRAQTRDDLFTHIARERGSFDLTLYRQLLGAANEYKEGDEAVGVAAADQASRANARALLSNTHIADLLAHPIFEDAVSSYIGEAVDPDAAAKIADWTFGELKGFLLQADEPAIHAIMPGLASDTIACVVKLMTNDDLIAVGRKVFNPLPGSNIGAKGYMGARIQPNSPTDDPDDIRWQVFDGFSYAVGDVVLGTNPVSSEVESVAAIENALLDLVQTFGLEDTLPHCVLSHIDVQAEVERQIPGSTGVWFQSLAGVADANTTFDISVEKMRAHAAKRTGKWGLYFETGQGADATNGHGKGFDMVIHEARNYGFARALRREVAEAQRAHSLQSDAQLNDAQSSAAAQRANSERANAMPDQTAKPDQVWVHLNDVAGFIGPEVFRTREQLVRCCLEDTVMGKLHGLTIGLDICSTLHMDVNLDDLDWCIEQVMPANPAYLMALPTKNDPMLSYLTTGFQDHVRIREKFGYKVNDAMWSFFQDLGVIDATGKPTEHFGQPTWVYLQYCRRKNDPRPDADILAEGRRQIEEVRARGVFIAEGHGANTWDLDPRLDQRIRYLYRDSKQCIRAEWPRDFPAKLTAAAAVATRSHDRSDYILHPPTGEELDARSEEIVRQLAARRRAVQQSAEGDPYDVQLVVSDGLNVYSLTDDGHLGPYLAALRAALTRAGYRTAPEHIVVSNGRVRAGYRVGELLFGAAASNDQVARDLRRAILHIIGERPGSGHHAFSVYITNPPIATWAQPGLTDHNVTKVVSGIADTALDPAKAALDTVRILA